MTWSPLLHWVRSHSRRMRDGNEIEIQDYLRGKRECEWQGYHCEIRESTLDRLK